jgi:DNA-binding NtrC family response regulator
MNEDGANSHIAEKEPDLIIIDYHLDNDVTGIDVVSNWQQSWLKDTPVIVITADYTDDVRHATKEKGFYLLKKPVRPLQLKALISKALN